MRTDLRVVLPKSRVIRLPRIGRCEDRSHVGTATLQLLGGEPVPQGSLEEPVHLNARRIRANNLQETVAAKLPDGQIQGGWLVQRFP